MSEERTEVEELQGEACLASDGQAQSTEKDQGAEKVMAWVGVVGNKVLPVHWFEEKKGVNGEAYLQLLKETVWPAIRTRATRNMLYFLQDGASPHTTNQVMQFLEEKFQSRVISRKAEFEWPARSPDLNPLDYWFW
jgi:hypothetical protein